MPVMNGIEATQALKQLMPDTPIIVFSEYCDVFSEREARSEGISALVSKTKPVSVLLDNARAVLDYTTGGFLSPSNQTKEQPHVHTRS